MLGAYKKTWLDAFEWKGRMRRDVYWKAMLVHVLCVCIPSLIEIVIFLENNEIFSYIGLFLITGSLFPMVAATIRRLHDVGKSGKWLLLYYITSFWIIGIIMFLIHTTDESVGDNRWGNGPEKEQQDDGDNNNIKGINTSSFVDERLTEQDIKNDRKKLRGVFIKILLIHLICIILYIAFQAILWNITL